MLAKAAEQKMPVAVVDFDYLDTSGEPADQRAQHQARLAAFMASLRADLVRSGKYELVALAGPGIRKNRQTKPRGAG